MAKDEFKNLGFKEDKLPVTKPDDGAAKGEKGKLRW
jgi:hypothetical protein